MTRVLICWCLALGPAFAAAQSPTTSLTLLAPFPTSTQSPNGAPDTEVTPAGPLPPGSFIQLSQTNGPTGVDARALIALTEQPEKILGVYVADTQVTQGLASSEVGPIDLRIDFAFAEPSYVQVNVDLVEVTTTGPGAFAQLDVDIGDDGTVDFQATPSAAVGLVSFPLDAPTTLVSVRVTGVVSAQTASYAAVSMPIGVTPLTMCDPVEVDGSCASSPFFLFSANPRYDGALRFEALGNPFANPLLLVVGFSELSLPLPIPGPSNGSCTLTPFPDVVVPMVQGQGQRSFFDVPLLGVPATAFAQVLAVEPSLAEAQTTRALWVVCP